ncbi:MAG TPA: hypothetical protein VFZ72_11905 [Jiangellaceae bacterium]
MGALAIALEAGFDDDHVIVHVDDRVVLDEDGVTTRYQIGLARMLEVPVTAGSVRVAVRLPERELAGETTVDAAETQSLRVSIENAALVFDAGGTPLFYA